MKVGFILLSSPEHPIPSTRVAALNMFPLLRERGAQCEVVFAPSAPAEQPEIPLQAKDMAEQGFDVICFQKVHGPSAVALAKALRALGVGTVFLVCDVVDAEMCAATDITVTVTEFLRGLYPAELRHKVRVAHDGIEKPEAVVRSHAANSVRLEAALVTSAHMTELPVLGLPPSWLRVSIIGPYPRSRRARLQQDWWSLRQRQGWRSKLAFLRFLLSPRIRRVTWTAQGVYSALADAQVGIIPILADGTPQSEHDEIPAWMRKSENRLTLKMSMGLPVVATPIPAYEPVLRSGINGYFARSRAEWLSALAELRLPERRASMGRQAREDVSSRFSMVAQCDLLLDALRAASSAARACRA